MLLANVIGITVIKYPEYSNTYVFYKFWQRTNAGTVLGTKKDEINNKIVDVEGSSIVLEGIRDYTEFIQ